jgi:hypothetical protein
LKIIRFFLPQLTCINISEAEFQTGINSAVGITNCPDFILMEAHDLQFEDETFDFIYGNGILHHLNMVPALDINPIGKLVRYLTKRREPPKNDQ